MDFFITWAIIVGLLVAPATINYYVSRWFTIPGEPLPSRLDHLAANLVLVLAVLAAAAFLILLISLAWDGLREEIADFVQGGLKGYGQDRPIALTGFLTAASLGCMGLMGALGALRVPARFLR